jgi:hypothetical protein
MTYLQYRAFVIVGGHQSDHCFILGTIRCVKISVIEIVMRITTKLVVNTAENSMKSRDKVVKYSGRCADDVN